MPPKQKKILFLYFTEPNCKWVEGVWSAVAKKAEIALLPGFDFEKARPPFRQLPPSTMETFPVSPLVPDSIYEVSGKLSQVIRNYRNDLVECLEDTRPDLIILPEDTDYARGRLGATVARQMGIPTSVFFPLYYQIFQSHPMVCPPMADEYLVMNSLMRSALIARGVSASKIHVTGIPGLSFHAPVMRSGPAVYLLQGDPFEEQLVPRLARLLLDLNVELWVRPHPKIPNPAWREAHSSLRWLDSKQPLRPIIDEIGFAMGQTSGALFEVLAQGLPAFFLHFRAGPAPMRLTPQTGSLQMTNLADLRTAIQRWQEGLLEWNTEELFGGEAAPRTLSGWLEQKV